mmetsp:Transcript_29809/g.85553  ORF Transcript_29809/g.85553 Transcript_29809/m.85553 type:complete len:342 (-) Transcript_29809:28-1053(-)
MPAILGMGNPLLDVSAEVDLSVFEKYNLKPGEACLAEESQQGIYAELAAAPGAKYIAGGATQNSIRVAQWMLQEPGSTAYMGCVGADDYAEKMRAACAKDGVQCCYMVDAAAPTGVCAVPIHGIERALCTTLAAANNYKAEHLQAPEHWKILTEAKIIYSAGFFITVSPESIKLASEEAMKTGALYCMNLSAEFICQVPPFRKVLNETLPLVDILFGNETEAAAFAGGEEGWDPKDIVDVAKRLSLIPTNKKQPRTVVITQGKDPTLVAVNGEVTEHPIIPLPKEQLVDTNGAGDSYVGGFLAGLSKGLPLDKCCKAGAHAASIIVQHSGCTYPEKPGYEF